MLAEIRAAKELSASDQAAGNHGELAERLLVGLGKRETKKEEAVHGEEQEEEVPGDNKVC